ncbi:MAG: deoxyhypusine synthase family protein, partial [Methanocorpusculum sp.]|nr:deoxyhypusine synthase family protein [Methanocorpusculum sp.]
MYPATEINELLERMSHTGFQGRKLGESYHIWKEMIETPGVKIILGLSGAMIPQACRNASFGLRNTGMWMPLIQPLQT